MPRYDYRCTACGREVEVMHGINEHGPESCAHCGGVMRKALSPPTIHFKGSGWAKKDAATARKTGPKAGAASDKDTGKGKGDSKPASDDASKPGTSSATSSASESTSKPGASTRRKTDS